MTPRHAPAPRRHTARADLALAATALTATLSVLAAGAWLTIRLLRAAATLMTAIVNTL
jgi:hypothetical protein